MITDKNSLKAMKAIMIKQGNDKITINKWKWIIMLIVKQHYSWIKKYIQKTVKHLKWSFILEIAISEKKLPLRCLTGIQVRKIVDDADNKGVSRLI